MARRLRPSGAEGGRRGKRLSRLAEWHFGSDGYCGSCAGVCPDCPERINAPQSVEGRQVWDLVRRCGGQIRASAGRVIGYDMAAVFMMGDALGVPRPAVAEFVPRIEAVARAAINAAAEEHSESMGNGTA